MDYSNDGTFTDMDSVYGLTYSNWASGEPSGGSNQNCVQLDNTADFVYKTYECTSKQFFMCEYALAHGEYLIASYFRRLYILFPF